MLPLEIVRAMTDYNYALHRRVWESIMTLTEEQFTAEIPYSHGSIRNHMVHLASTDINWLRGLKEMPDSRIRYYPAEYPTRETARELFESAAGDVTSFVATLDETALAYQPHGLPMPTWQVLLHLVNHGTDHRAQILRALHDIGAPTFDQDVVFYVMGR